MRRVTTPNTPRQTFKKMEGFSFVTHVTGLNRPNTGKEDDDVFVLKEVVIEIALFS
jgi:hypothetical protein